MRTTEYRTGLHYVLMDPLQTCLRVPDQQRFPHLLSVYAQVLRDKSGNLNTPFRSSSSSDGQTNHFKLEATHSDIGDATYIYLVGQRGRRPTADSDVLFS